MWEYRPGAARVGPHVVKDSVAIYKPVLPNILRVFPKLYEPNCPISAQKFAHWAQTRELCPVIGWSTY